jgi:3-phosphoglycerate kinase
MIKKPLLDYCSGARQRYHNHLDKVKEGKVEKTKAVKRKIMDDELKELKKKVKKVKQDIDFLRRETDKCAEEAERKNDMGLILLSNNHRRRAKEKKSELEKFEKKVADKETEFLNM